jgi:tRNA pseudouridine38-40 synthase
MRWRIDLSYQGTNYNGWQKQPGDRTVQQTLEEAFNMILRQPVEITGCGRTDTGVHARKYTAHTDISGDPDIVKTIYQINAVLPYDIAIHSIRKTADDFHARFNAVERQYKYYIHLNKDPFLQHLSYYFNLNMSLNKEAMMEAAKVLLQHDEFLPFCKTGSDAQHYQCQLTQAEWSFANDKMVFTISSNRFLRGMVRLIVGAGLNIGVGKITVEELDKSLREQKPLSLQWSVPPEGLYLENVVYPGD